MSRIRFMSPYLKGGCGAAQRANRVRYFATRPGVELLPDEHRDLPATKKQVSYLRRLLRAFPDAKETLEYEEYQAAPTRENASEFIRQTREDFVEAMSQRENFLDYVAHRPGVELHGDHGLWGPDGKVQNLSRAVEEVANHTGNVWTPVVAIRREDAERLGYDTGANWQALVNACLCDIAKGYKIHPDHLRWYAAFHEKEKSVHIHIVVFSTDPKEGFLTKAGIQQVKSAFTRRIFQQDLLHVYEQKTRYRDTLQREAADRMEELIRQMRTGAVDDPRLERLIAALAARLNAVGGKKVYGYLPPRIKEIVDEIVDELSRDARVAAAYDLWQQMREKSCRVYGGSMPERVPLSRQKDFKPVRNMVVREALRLSQENQEGVEPPDSASDVSEGGVSPADDLPEEQDTEETTAPKVRWSVRYKEARQSFYGSETTPRDLERALALFREEADGGNALAMCDLGRMYADGLTPDGEANQEISQAWYSKGLAALLAAEEQRPDRYVEYRIGKLYAAGLGTERDYETAAGWFAQSAEQGYPYAQYSLAGLCRQGRGVERDDTKAYRLYTLAARQGFPYAHFELGKLLRDGVGCARDVKRAREHFRAAFLGFHGLERQSHDDKLQYRIGWMLLQGVGTEQDAAAAREWLQKAARLGNVHAKVQLAKLTLADVTAGPEQLRGAVAFLREAAENGHDGAQYTLGKLYRDGGAIEKDIKEADRWFRLSAEAGNEYAQYALGRLLLEQGNEEGAGQWLERSSEQGNQFAQYALGMLLLERRDTGNALRWLRESAEHGNGFAQYRLGMVYLRGEAVEKQVDRAVDYLTASAKGGNQFAQYTLGRLYLLGLDVPRDQDRAIRWLTRSAEQGNVYAQFLLDHPNCLQTPSAAMTVSRMLYHMGRIFEENCKADAVYHGLQIDRKRRQQLRDKKTAMGHKADDHEGSEMHMQ